jgi:hypothetical protein
VLVHHADLLRVGFREERVAELLSVEWLTRQSLKGFLSLIFIQDDLQFGL